MLLSECLHVNSRSLKHKQQPQKLLALKGRGTKLISVTQESTVQDYRSEQMASSLFFSLRIMLGFISNPTEEISFNFSSVYQQEWERERSEAYRLAVSID